MFADHFPYMLYCITLYNLSVLVEYMAYSRYPTIGVTERWGSINSKGKKALHPHSGPRAVGRVKYLNGWLREAVGLAVFPMEVFPQAKI